LRQFGLSFAKNMSADNVLCGRSKGGMSPILGLHRHESQADRGRTNIGEPLPVGGALQDPNLVSQRKDLQFHGTRRSQYDLSAGPVIARAVECPFMLENPMSEDNLQLLAGQDSSVARDWAAENSFGGNMPRKPQALRDRLDQSTSMS
jgi:hypothetical protein